MILRQGLPLDRLEAAERQRAETVVADGERLCSLRAADR